MSFVRHQAKAESRRRTRQATFLRDLARDEAMVTRVFLREVDGGTLNACWVVCAKGDPGAVPFVPELSGFQRIG